jgi:two-component system, NtrC family, response regulator HydG
MNAELIVVNGPLTGRRYPLLNGELLVGRAPNADVVLSEPDVGWRHCQIHQRGGRFTISDLRSAIGTYVNGMRSAERWLEDRDQIGVGKTVLMFRSGQKETAPPAFASEAHEAKPVLLAACSLVFLFRALAAASSDPAQTQVLRNLILRLVSDFVPSEEGFLLLGKTAAELQERLEEFGGGCQDQFSAMLRQVCEEGATTLDLPRMVGVPLYMEGVLGGVLMVQVQQKEAEKLSTHLETLTAVASLASVGFEANREVETLKAEKALLQQEIASSSGIVGNSPPIRRLLALIDRVAPRDTTVLITGESGTGKELVARALHDKSARHERPFVAVNCAALSESLFESELFGHEKGAFTGAVSLKRGRFELAQGGTIFLDEVGELALPLQAKLLRVLQQREFERVGGTQVLSLDIRVIAATNRDLSDDVREGKFREDLYHRLNVVTLNSPALRDRKEDIPLLARYFLERSATRCKRQIQGLSKESEELLCQYQWPGNVRELENAMERAVVLGVSDLVLPEDLPETLLEVAPQAGGTRYHSSVGQAKREAILEAYAQNSGDYKLAAKALGLHPNYLLRLVRNLGLRDDINGLSTSAGR